MKHTEQIRDYIFANISDSGIFTKTYTSISQDLDINVNIVRKTILDMVTHDSVLEVIEPPKRGVNSKPIYRVKSRELKLSQFNPTTEINEDREVVFEGVTIKLIHRIGNYLISSNDVAMCTLSDISTLQKIVNSNKPVFKDHVVVINNEQFLTKQGVFLFLMKVNVDKILDIKKSVISKFQLLVVEHMVESTLRANLQFTEQNRIEIRHNLHSILEVDKEAVEIMIEELESQINGMVDTISISSTRCERQLHKLERDNQQSQSRYEIEKRAKENLITENQSLRNKLLERS